MKLRHVQLCFQIGITFDRLDVFCHSENPMLGLIQSRVCICHHIESPDTLKPQTHSNAVLASLLPLKERLYPSSHGNTRPPQTSCESSAHVNVQTWASRWSWSIVPGRRQCRWDCFEHHGGWVVLIFDVLIPTYLALSYQFIIKFGTKLALREWFFDQILCVIIM